MNPNASEKPADAAPANERVQQVALRHWLPLAGALVRAIINRDLASAGRVIEELLKLLTPGDTPAQLTDLAETLLTRAESHALIEAKPIS